MSLSSRVGYSFPSPRLMLMSTAELQQRSNPDVRNVVSFLRSSKSEIKVRVGALNGKRLDYSRTGKSAIKALLSPAYAKLKNVPKVTTEAEAQTTLQSINSYAFFLRVQRGAATGSSSSPKVLQIIPQQMFGPEEYYAWFYEGSQWTTYVGGLVMVVLILAGVMFPLWPPIMRLGVWYLSVGMLGLIGLFFALAIVQLIFYIITVVVASPGIWIFPQLFADVGFIESFIPLWEWDVPKKKGKKKKGEKAASNARSTNGSGAYIEEIDESGPSRPQSRSARVEEIDDEDAPGLSNSK